MNSFLSVSGLLQICASMTFSEQYSRISRPVPKNVSMPHALFLPTQDFDRMTRIGTHMNNKRWMVMRTEDQIRRKVNELLLQKKSVEERLAAAEEDRKAGLQSDLDRLDDMILLLEWVLNKPVGSYHG